MKKILHILRIIIAVIFIVLGAFGLLIPVFPTVPFLVSAALILGKKPSDVIKFLNGLTRNIRLVIKKTIRRIRKKRLKNHD